MLLEAGAIRRPASVFFSPHPISRTASSPRGQSLTLLKPLPPTKPLYSPPAGGLRSVSTDTERIRKHSDRTARRGEGNKNGGPHLEEGT